MSPFRAFKTKWFAKAANKRGITDLELSRAVKEAAAGQADDLGGGVYKKRLNKNMDRSILLAKSGSSWIYVFLFHKADRDNIEGDELMAFRVLAKTYARITPRELTALIDSNELVEICTK